MKFIFNKYIVSTLVLLLLTMSVQAANREYYIKAAFLEKFAKYVYWPKESKFYETKHPFTILVYGDSPIIEVLREMYSQRKIIDKDVVIRHTDNLEAKFNCDILFLADSRKQYIGNVVEALKNEPTLIVSESPGLASKGAMINFYITKSNTVHFEINLRTVNESKLKINLLLIEIARTVK